MDYVIEELLPAHQVHLIGGPSGAGKTRLTFQMYKAMMEETPFLGHKTHPVKWAYISGDRPERSVRETMKDMEVDFPVYSLVDTDQIGKSLVGIVIPSLTGYYKYKPDFIYIDGFTAMVDGKMNDYLDTAKWLGGLQRYCDAKGVTILGACHTTKTKEGERFLNPRQRIAGSVAWAGFSETVILVEPNETPGKDDERMVSLLPRNAEQRHVTMYFDNTGQLLLSEVADKESQKAEGADFVLPMILKYRLNEPLDYKGNLNLAVERGVSRRTFDRWLVKRTEDGTLEHLGKGSYVVKRHLGN